VSVFTKIFAFPVTSQMMRKSRSNDSSEMYRPKFV